MDKLWEVILEELADRMATPTCGGQRDNLLWIYDQDNQILSIGGSAICPTILRQGKFHGTIIGMTLKVSSLKME